MIETQASDGEIATARTTQGDVQAEEGAAMNDQLQISETDLAPAASVNRPVHDLPSNKLGRDHNDSSFSFSLPLTDSNEDTTSKATRMKPHSRRGSMASFRPLVNAVTTANRLASKINSTDKHESQRYEAMVQHFQVRRLKTLNTPLEPPQPSTSDDSNDGEPVEPLTKEAPPSDGTVQSVDKSTGSQSFSPEPRRNEVKRSQQPSADPQDVLNASSFPAEARNQSIEKINLAVSRQSRFSLSRWLKSWRHKLTKMRHRVLTLLSEPMSPLSSNSQLRGILLLIACVWYITYTPFKLAFSVDSTDCWNHFMEIPLELLFLMDFLLGFNTSFVDEAGELVTSRKLIAWHYLRGWMVPDLLSSVPIGIITILRDGHMNSRDTLWNGGIRVQRLVHVVLVIGLPVLVVL